MFWFKKTPGDVPVFCARILFSRFPSEFRRRTKSQLLHQRLQIRLYKLLCRTALFHGVSLGFWFPAKQNREHPFLLRKYVQRNPDKPTRRLDATELMKYSLGMYLSFQTNALASEDRKEYLKNLLNATTSRRESSLIDTLDYLGISQEQFETCSLVETRVKDELKHTRKMWKF